MVTWGFRQMEESIINTFTLVEEARLPCDSPKMQRLLGTIGKDRGSNPNKLVYEHLRAEYLSVKLNADIGPQKPFFADKSYGDIDVLVIERYQDFPMTLMSLRGAPEGVRGGVLGHDSHLSVNNLQS